MKIILLYNRVRKVTYGRPEDILADEDTVQTSQAIKRALSSLGHKVLLLEINENNINRLKKTTADLFFNQAFGLGSLPKSEAVVAQALAETGRPFTGSAAAAINLTTNKIVTKKLLQKHRLPTPRYQVFRHGREKINPALRYPLLIKPSAEDCSLGIDGEAIAIKESDAATRIKCLLKQYPEPVLAEEYIAGREINATIIGNGRKARVLPLSEIIFGPSFKNRYKIVGFAAKWKNKSREYRDTVGVCPADLPEKIGSKIERLARRAYLLTGCRDYARVDIRLSVNNIPYILEVNANPGIGPDDGAVRSARAAGYSYPDFLGKIVEVAIERYQNKTSSKSQL